VIWGGRISVKALKKDGISGKNNLLKVNWYLVFGSWNMEWNAEYRILDSKFDSSYKILNSKYKNQ